MLDAQISFLVMESCGSDSRRCLITAHRLLLEPLLPKPAKQEFRRPLV